VTTMRWGIAFLQHICITRYAKCCTS